MMPDPIISVLLTRKCRISKIIKGEKKPKNYNREVELFCSKTHSGCSQKRNQKAI